MQNFDTNHSKTYRSKTFYLHLEGKTLVLFYLHQQVKMWKCCLLWQSLITTPTIRRAPSLVNAENQETVWLTLYADSKLKKPKLKVGDQFRLSMKQMRFRKGYLPGRTDKLFQVAQVFQKNPPYYKIKDLQGELLEESFYEEELQKICKKDNENVSNRTYSETAQAQESLEFLINWFYYPASFNSWVKEKRPCMPA